MEETRSFSVAADQEQEETEVWQDFGWSLIGNQEVNIVDNYMERNNDAIQQVRSHQRYIKLTFKRNTNMPNYAQIKEYETQYHAKRNEPLKSAKGSAFLIFLAIACAVAAYFAHLLLLIATVAALVGGIVIIVTTSKKNEAIRKRNSERNEAKRRLRQEARALLQ